MVTTGIYYGEEEGSTVGNLISQIWCNHLLLSFWYAARFFNGRITTVKAYLWLTGIVLRMQLKIVQ
jgi:hypothetical protein